MLLCINFIDSCLLDKYAIIYFGDKCVGAEK